MFVKSKCMTVYMHKTCMTFLKAGNICYFQSLSNWGLLNWWVTFKKTFQVISKGDQSEDTSFHYILSSHTFLSAWNLQLAPHLTALKLWDRSWAPPLSFSSHFHPSFPNPVNFSVINIPFIFCTSYSMLTDGLVHLLLYLSVFPSC